MAARTSASVGMTVTVAIFSVLSLALFITTVLFFAKTQRLTRDLDEAELALEDAVRQSERNDRWDQIRSQAGGEGMGAVKWLDEQRAQLAMMVSGERTPSIDGLQERRSEILGQDAPPLLDAVRSSRQQISRLQGELDKLRGELEASNVDLQAEVERVESIEEEHAQTVASLNAEIDNYKQRIDEYRDDVGVARGEMDDRVEDIRAELEDRISELETENSDLDAQIRIAQAQLKEFRAEKAKETLRPGFEGALVDGAVLGVNAPAQEVYIDRGSNDRVVLGMTFEIYDSGAAIRVNPETGQYPRGKATIELTRIGDSSSTGRILFERRGNPIVQGDVIANAIYDPQKTYSFTVFGNFDTNGDGIATSAEASDIRGIIDAWGGDVREDLTGDTDFLVLGVKPILPPEPKPTDPIEVIRNFINLRENVDRYDTLFESAQQTGIPVLNQNRLYTLTGMHARR